MLSSALSKAWAHIRCPLEIAAAVLPSRPPPFLPLRAIELVFPELAIHFVMRLAHPAAKAFSSLRSRRILGLRDPLLEIAGAGPAWV